MAVAPRTSNSAAAREVRDRAGRAGPEESRFHPARGEVGRPQGRGEGVRREGDDEAVEAARSLFESVGRTLVTPEELMVSATALVACGVAFFLRCIRAASQGGIEIGFHPKEALVMAAQTARGAASLVLREESHPEGEIDRVTTPRGSTIAGLNEMEHQGFSSAFSPSSASGRCSGSLLILRVSRKFTFIRPIDRPWLLYPRLPLAVPPSRPGAVPPPAAGRAPPASGPDVRGSRTGAVVSDGG